MANKSSMKCNRPVPSDRPGKKKMVKACQDGKERLIHFGAEGYGHNYSTAARKSFRARHGCDTASDKLTARYWACKNLWAGPGGDTKSSPKSRKGKY
jgi:hypothetical protein